MKNRNALAWLIAGLPLICVGYLFLEIAEAVSIVGHIPQYRVDADPFHTNGNWILPDWGFIIYFPLSFLFGLGEILLFIPGFRYRGRYKIPFYALAALSAVATCVFVIRDVTGFVTWRLD